MSTPTTPNSTLITVQHPDGSIRLAVPADVSLGELMPDFLEVTRQPDCDGWMLGPADGEAYPNDSTLAQLGVDDGAVLVLRDATSPAGSGFEDERTTEDRCAALRGAQAQRPLSEQTASTLPERVSQAARCRIAARALVGASPPTGALQRSAVATGGPATFTRAGRVSALTRLRDAWTDSDYERRLDRLVFGMRLQRCVRIAVVSPKGGVGKTTTAALLGSLLAFLRRDRVVAVETNPDWGSLGRRLVPDHPIFIDDLLAGPLADGRLVPTELDAQLGRGPDGLMVAPAPTDPDRATKLDEAAYRTLFARLGELVGTLVLDCGTGLDDPPARAALACADQLILVCDDEPDTASIVAEAAEWLRRSAPPLVLVANNVRRFSRVDLAALERATSFARGIAIIPRDDRAAVRLHGSHFSWAHAPAGWRTPVRELAGLLAADWLELGIAA